MGNRICSSIAVLGIQLFAGGPALAQSDASWSLSVFGYPFIGWKNGVYLDKCGDPPKTIDEATERRFKLAVEGLVRLPKIITEAVLRDERKNALMKLGGDAVASQRLDYYGCVFILSNTSIPTPEKPDLFQRLVASGRPEPAPGKPSEDVTELTFSLSGQAPNGVADKLAITLPRGIATANAAYRIALKGVVAQTERAAPPAGWLEVVWGVANDKGEFVSDASPRRYPVPAGEARNLTPQPLSDELYITPAIAKPRDLLFKITGCGYIVNLNGRANPEFNGKDPEHRPFATCQFKGTATITKFQP